MTAKSPLRSGTPAANEWVAWHRQYGHSRPLTRRLLVVQRLIGEAIDSMPSGRIRVISACAGDGRDLLGALAHHARSRDVRARLVELDPVLAARARRNARRLGLRGVRVVCGDASTSSAYRAAVPADLLLLCGIFGNISDSDIRRTIRSLRTLCASSATVVWTRGRFPPDLTPTIRRWFQNAGFEELAFVKIPGTTASVGAARLTRPRQRFRPGRRLFTFLPKALRPSTLARQAPHTHRRGAA